MTNREARERLRAVGWTYAGCRAEYNFGQVSVRWFAWGSPSRLFELSAIGPSRATANRRLVEFVEKHFGEGK